MRTRIIAMGSAGNLRLLDTATAAAFRSRRGPSPTNGIIGEETDKSKGG